MNILLLTHRHCAPQITKCARPECITARIYLTCVCVCVCVCSMWHDLLPFQDFYIQFWKTFKDKITCGVWINFFSKIKRQFDAYVRVRAWFARTGVQTARGGLVCLPPKTTPSQTHHAPRNNAITNPPRTQPLADSEAAHCHAH